MMKQHEQKRETAATPDAGKPIPLWQWLLIFFVVVVLLLLAPPRTKLPKHALVGRYGVDKKTFNKWLEIFCSDLIPHIGDYKRRRTITLSEYRAVFSRLGNPAHYPVLTKKDIIERGEGTYYSLRDSVACFPGRFGLSIEAYISLSKFPPNISRQIVEQYG
jgi:hypothetical protein